MPAPLSVRVLVCAGATLLVLACNARERETAPGQQPRVVVIGLDGADLRWVDRLRESG